MMLNVLASGTLVSDPRERVTVAGKPYATASMRVPVEDGEATLASLICLNADAVQALLVLRKGDACAIAGRGKVSTWEKDGEQRYGLSVVADRVLTAYQAGKLRKAAREAEEA
jgi:single-stranded DNA-binding protein